MKRREALKNTGFLVGCGLSAGTIAAFISGCQPGDKTTPGSLLSDSQLELLGNICETIIPETDTPGAMAAGVHTYINSVAKDMMQPEEVEAFTAGLTQINEKAKADFNKSFNELNQGDRESVLLAIEAEGGDANPFNMLAGLTKQVFFTSEVGATEVLAFDPIPGEYVGCVPVSDYPTLWAL